MKIYRINNVKIKESMDGEQIVILNQNHMEECFRYINENNITEIEIDNTMDKYNDLSFLNECVDIKALYLDNHFIKDISIIYSLKNLIKFGIEEPKIAIDFADLLNLEQLYITWHKKIEGLKNLSNLKELSIWNYAPKTQDLQEISSLENLENLIITQSKIGSLNGIGKLPLKSLQLNFLRTLKEINEVGDVTSLEKVELESCKKIIDYSYLGNLNQLQELILLKCGDIESIGFVKKLNNLKRLSFYGSNIKDGDIGYCENIENLWFDNKKHYSHKISDFRDDF